MAIVIGLGSEFDIKDPLGLYKGEAPGLSPQNTAQPLLKPIQPPKQAEPIAGIEGADWNDLVDTVIAEAGGEGPDGMAAVAHAIRNRATVRNKNVGEVIREPNQFVGYSNPGEAAVRAQQDPGMRARAEQILQGVFGGKVPDPTGGADHFLSGDAMPAWAEKMPETARIGGHRFYASAG